jgi:hypothetical protein
VVGVRGGGGGGGVKTRITPMGFLLLWDIVEKSLDLLQ